MSNDSVRYDGPRKKLMYLLAKKINLLDFIENETGHDFHRMGRQHRCLCPLHEEKTPSFFVWQGSDGGWAFKCYGCGRKGTIIDFCMYFHNFSQPIQALAVIAEKCQIDGEFSLAKMLEAVTVKVDKERKLDSLHYIASSNCRLLLREFFELKEVREWVKQSYRKMNQCLESADVSTMDEIRHAAHNKLVEYKQKKVTA